MTSWSCRHGLSRSWRATGLNNKSSWWAKTCRGSSREWSSQVRVVRLCPLLVCLFFAPSNLTPYGQTWLYAVFKWRTAIVWRVVDLSVFLGLTSVLSFRWQSTRWICFTPSPTAQDWTSSLGWTLCSGRLTTAGTAAMPAHCCSIVNPDSTLCPGSWATVHKCKWVFNNSPRFSKLLRNSKFKKVEVT